MQNKHYCRLELVFCACNFCLFGAVPCVCVHDVTSMHYYVRTAIFMLHCALSMIIKTRTHDKYKYFEREHLDGDMVPRERRINLAGPGINPRHVDALLVKNQNGFFSENVGIDSTRDGYMEHPPPLIC